MILEYIEGTPKESGWYFINYGENQSVKAVLVSEAKDNEGNIHYVAQVDIVVLPVEQMAVNAWAGPIWLRPIQFDAPAEEQEDKPVEPELVEGE